jgi:hypothetical protein
LNQLIVLVLVLTVAVIAIAFFLSPNSPFKSSTTTTPAPITIGQIKKLYRMETAQVTGQTIVEGETKNALPFSSAKLTYQVVMTMTAGIDMSQLKDSDVRIEGDTLTIVLPSPQVLNEEDSFTPVAENKEIFSGPSEKKELPQIIVDEGKRRVRQTILEQGQLMKDARTNAEDELRNLIFQIAPQYKTINFVQTPLPSASPGTSPGPTGAPR